MTITIQIDNSDDKLTQQEWAAYCQDILSCVKIQEFEIHFYGCSFGALPWQNACWILVPTARTNLEEFKVALTLVRKDFKQDSLAWSEGETRFI